jgi:probable rRNA maturation factor
VIRNSRIQFFKEGVRFRILHGEAVKQWILKAFRENKTDVQQVNYIFCSDRYLLRLNKDFLGHRYLTDVITFDHTVEEGKVEADIYISTERVADNAQKFNTGFTGELHRVMIHGALHLMGYNDKKTGDKEAMREAEDHWLSRRRFAQK